MLLARAKRVKGLRPYSNKQAEKVVQKLQSKYASQELVHAKNLPCSADHTIDTEAIISMHMAHRLKKKYLKAITI